MRSDIWIAHHIEAMEAARAEFMAAWPGWIEKHRATRQPLFKGNSQPLNERGLQTILWRAFLRKKGLLLK